MTKKQEARETAIRAGENELIRMLSDSGTQSIPDNAARIIDLPEVRAYYEALMEQEGYVKVPEPTMQDIEATVL